MTDVAIIGAGTAGLTAAIYARRAGRSVVIFEGEAPGGQIINTPEIDNFPGMPGVSGYEYANKLYEQAQQFGAEFVFDTVKKVTGSAEEGFHLMSEYGSECDAKTVIIASGVKRREMGLAGEQEYTGRGISYCATCDGAFFRKKVVAVVGGGDVALEDAIYLARTSAKVYLIHRRDELRGTKVLQEELMSKENVEILYSHVVKEICGEDNVERLILEDVKTGEKKELPVNGVFIAVGIHPDSELVKGLVDLDPSGYVIADETCASSCPGIFAAGDVRKKPIRQVVTAVADGANAATSAGTYVQKH